MARSRRVVRIGTLCGSLALAWGVVPSGGASVDRAADPQGAGSHRTGSDRVVAPRTIDAVRLPRGRDAEIDHLQDGVIHTAGGRTLPIRTPVNGEQRQLLGRRGKAWLVAVRTGYLSRVIAVRPGRRPVEVPRTRITTYGQGDAAVGWLLSRDGELLVSTTFDRGGSTSSVLGLDDSRWRGTSYTGAYVTPFDADAGHVATYADNEFYRLRVMDWVPRTSRTEIAKSAAYVSLRDDLVFTRTTGRLYGPSSISAPGTPAWAAPISPLAVAPDGETVAGLRIARSSFDDPAILDVRAMDDGTLLDSIVLGPRITMDSWSITSAHEQTVRWESARRFLLQLRTPRGAVLVRCRLDGGCQRASAYGGNVTTPHETFMWW